MILSQATVQPAHGYRHSSLASGPSPQVEPDHQPTDYAEVTTSSPRGTAKASLVGLVLAAAPALVSATAGPQTGFAVALGLAVATGVATRCPLKGLGALVLGTYATRFGMGGVGFATGFSAAAAAGFGLTHHLGVDLGRDWMG